MPGDIINIVDNNHVDTSISDYLVAVDKKITGETRAYRRKKLA
ncbi:MAG: hypothetical protein ACR5K4_02230 [Sodalis sp. (in: enterobacteria)]